MKDIIRDSTVGGLFNRFSGGKILPFAEQRPDYVIPERYLLPSLSPSKRRSPLDTPIEIDSAGTPTLVDAHAVCKELDKLNLEKLDCQELGEEASPTTSIRPEYIVTWDGPDDPDNPRNWSRNKKLFVTGMICLLTAAMYMGSAVYSPSIPGIMVEFGVSEVAAVSGLSLFVFAYGISPLLLTSLQDVSSVGRNPVYISCIFLFALLQAPILLAPNIYVLLVFRFITGFLAGPALGTGGASLMDLWPPSASAYAIVTWALSASMGPVLGPVMGGFPAMKMGWRWPIYILLWLASFAFIVLSIFLPETLEGTILRHRAERLRRLTGNPHLRSESEIEEEGQTALGLTYVNFVHTCQLSLEPAVLFANTYLGFVYSIFYLWFEAFPFVFQGIYGFNLGLQGLPFIGMLVSGAITYVLYVLYNLWHIDPRRKLPEYTHEVRLEIGVFASMIIPISLFIFGWSAHYETHWMGPTFGAALYFPAIFLLFQSVLCYISDSYPRYTSAVLASNDFARSSVASVFPLFGVTFFKHLGVGGGLSLLAGLSIIMVPIIYALMKYGTKLRSKSKWTAEKIIR